RAGRAGLAAPLRGSARRRAATSVSPLRRRRTESSAQLSVARQRARAEESRATFVDSGRRGGDQARRNRARARDARADERAARQTRSARAAVAGSARAFRARLPPAAAHLVQRQGRPARETRRHGANALVPQAALARRRLPPAG